MRRPSQARWTEACRHPLAPTATVVASSKPVCKCEPRIAAELTFCGLDQGACPAVNSKHHSNVLSGRARRGCAYLRLAGLLQNVVPMSRDFEVRTDGLKELRTAARRTKDDGLGNELAQARQEIADVVAQPAGRAVPHRSDRLARTVKPSASVKGAVLCAKRGSSVPYTGSVHPRAAQAAHPRDPSYCTRPERSKPGTPLYSGIGSRGLPGELPVLRRDKFVRLHFH